MAQLLCGVITLYRLMLSPVLGQNCRFEPSCSEYAQQSLIRFGALRGLVLAIARISRCHPWGGCGYDPVPTHIHGWRPMDARCSTAPVCDEEKIRWHGYP